MVVKISLIHQQLKLIERSSLEVLNPGKLLIVFVKMVLYLAFLRANLRQSLFVSASALRLDVIVLYNFRLMRFVHNPLILVNSNRLWITLFMELNILLVSLQ